MYSNENFKLRIQDCSKMRRQIILMSYDTGIFELKYSGIP